MVDDILVNRTTLGERLLRGRPQLADPDLTAPQLEAALGEIVEAAQRAWPAVGLPVEAFLAHVGERLTGDSPLLRALRRLHTADLYLACACARGDARAFAAFEDHCLRRLGPALHKIDARPDVIDDIKQHIRGTVLVGIAGRAQIVDFSGRGDLRGWVHVIAVHLALQQRQRARREIGAEDDELLERIASPGDLELDHAKQLYRREFKQAFQDALRALTDRERTLLRQHYIDGLTVDELGALYRVHRSTAARMVARSRLAVLEATRAQMMAQLDIQSEQLDSILQMIRSQIEFSWSAIRS
jgi:RNA polymerase sigma-70 factor (ECF subfamily)